MLRTLDLLRKTPHLSVLAPYRQNQHPLTTLRSLLNPPDTTLPPDLHVATQSPNQSKLSYWYHVGRSYAIFYKTGVSNTWSNYKAARAIRDRLSHGPSSSSSLTRADRLLLRRSVYDMRRIPFFALLFLLVGEWLPLLVPFMPRVVPLTCRIPAQEDGMRKQQAEWRVGALQELERSAPGGERGGREWIEVLGEMLHASASSSGEQGQQPVRQGLVGKSEEAVPMCRVLGLYSPKFDWAVGSLPGFMARGFLAGRLRQHLEFLRADDQELLEAARRAGGLEQVAVVLSKEERVRACEDRGLDVFQQREEEVRGMLVRYLGSVARTSKGT
ncbi:MAG: hypothetical protein Q9157_001582 [Trypethelium eluteriae]